MIINFYVLYIVLNEEDPALELVTLKQHMNSDIDRMKDYYLKHEKGNVITDVFIYNL